MITSERLAVLTGFTPEELTQVIRSSGYKTDRFDTAKFLGLTTGGQFCYSATYKEDGVKHTVKVFVTYDFVKEVIEASY